MCISILYIYIYACVYNFKDIVINKEKGICLPNNKSQSGHRCERTNVAAKCEMFMNWSKTS